jgi:hypothetical protein
MQLGAEVTVAYSLHEQTAVVVASDDVALDADLGAHRE